MNRVHRVVWSDSRQAYVVASEKAKTRGKPSSTRKAVALAVFMALATMAASPAMAATSCPGTGGSTISIAANETSTCNLATGDALTVTNTGSISGADPAVAVNGTDAASIDNSGTMSGTTWGIDVYNAGGVTGAITNSNSITGGNFGIHIASGSSVGSITNNTGGAITGGGGGISFFTGSSVTGGITNNTGGAITGGSYGIGLNNSNLTGGIVNSGTISGGRGIYLVNGSIVDSITNNTSGTISGFRGIDVVGSGVTGSISNSGLITASTGIRLSSASTAGSISNSGTITASSAGIRLTSGSVAGSITNSGTITSSSAGIRLTSGSVAGSITNSGTIFGAYNGIYLSRSSSVTGAITNDATGTIASSSGSGAAILLSSGSSVGSITNDGTISGGRNGIRLQANTSGSPTGGLGASSVTGDITNTGTISGSSAGISLDSGSSIGGSIVNSGTIAGNNAAIDIRGSSSIVGSITNNVGGTIIGRTGTGTGPAFGTGIYVSNSSIGSITNNGTINGGIALTNNSTVTGGITNNGTITGVTNAIYITSSSTVGGITNTGTINGAVVLGGTTLNLNGTAGSISGAVTGGAGSTVNVNGTFTTADTFAVDSFNIVSGGLLNMGHGVTTTSGFSNAGTLSVAEAGNVTISGDYTQTASGTYRVGAASNAVYGKLIVTGTATLPAAARIDVDVNSVNTLATGDTLTGVLTAGTLSASTFAVTDNSALFDFTGAINGNAIDLTIAGASTTGVVDAVNSTGSTSALGAAAVFDALIAAPPGGDMDSVITALGALSTQQAVSDAVTQTLPLMTGGMTQFTFASLRSVNRVVQARQGANRGLSSGDDFVDNRNLWIKPLGSWADQENRNGAFGYDAQTYGVVLGADGELSQISQIGAAFAYTQSTVDSNSNAQTADVNSYLTVLYGSRSLDEYTELNWQADYGYNQNKGDRHIAFVNRTARSSYTSDSYHLGAGVGRTIPMSEKTSFIPSFRADYTVLKENGYTETGADALNLAVDGKTTDELILAVDGKVEHKMSDTSTLTANLGVGYDTQAKQSSITSSFVGGGAAFTTDGINPSSTVVRGGLRMVINSSDAMEVTARYDIETRSSGYTGQTFSVKLRKPF